MLETFMTINLVPLHSPRRGFKFLNRMIGHQSLIANDAEVNRADFDCSGIQWENDIDQ